MIDHPDKYPDAIVVLGSTPTTAQKSFIHNVFMKTMESVEARKDGHPQWKLRQFLLAYFTDIFHRYGSSSPHASSLALTCREDGTGAVGIFDNGKRKVSEFTVEGFARVLRDYWAGYFCNLTL